MDQIKSEPCDNMNEQQKHLLFLLGQMRQMQAASNLQRESQISISPPTPSSGFYKRPAEDQPLDFSAPKNLKLSPKLFPGYSSYPDNKMDSFGSDGNSDRLSPGYSSDSPREHLSDLSSPGSISDSPREPLPGSSSPPRPSLPQLYIPTPSSKDSVSSKADLLTTVSSAQLSNPLSSTAHRFPLLRPIASLQLPEHSAQDFMPRLNLNGLGATKPSLANTPVSLSLPFPTLPIFPPTQNPLSLIDHKSSFGSMPFTFKASPPSQEPLDQLTKISVDSNQKYAEFRDNMLKNIETTRTKSKKGDQEIFHSYTPGTPNNKHNDSLDVTPIRHSTPTASENIQDGNGKDSAYWERRRKNNEAAKRSRDSRRQKENDIAIRAQYLEQENIQLKMELVQLRTELGSIQNQRN